MPGDLDPVARRKTLKSARKDVPTEAEVQKRILAAQEASDYEAAVVSAALLEHMLMLLLATRMISLSKERHDALFENGGNSPFSTLSSKIKVSHALGLINNNVRLQCERICLIRNHFAHQNVVSFNDDEVIAECAGFINSKLVMDGVVNIENLTSNKLKYVQSCMYVCIYASVFLLLKKEQQMIIQTAVDIF